MTVMVDAPFGGCWFFVNGRWRYQTPCRAEAYGYKFTKRRGEVSQRGYVKLA